MGRQPRTDPDAPDAEAPGRFRDGWHNYDPDTGRRYWVRASDLGQPKMRRFKGRDTDERFEGGA